MENSSRRNPYIIGRPINEQELFFGRKPVFRFIEDNLKQGMQAILLRGERRIGKSSLLKQIPNFVTLEEFVFVLFDLEYHNSEPLSSVLQSLATDIIGCLNSLKLDSNQIKLPTIADLEKNINIFNEQFLHQVYKALGSKKLALLLDEFDISTTGNSDSAFETFFSHLSSIINLQEKFFIIVCLGRQSSDMPKLLSLFKEAPSKKIDLLDNEDAKALITQPAKGVLEYSEDAIQAILNLSGGHPYFIQIICFTLFGQARNTENWNVTYEDVESVIDKAIESAEGGLSWLWDGLSIPEKVVISAMSEAQEKRTSEEPFKLLKNHGIQRTKTLKKAENQLAKKGFWNEKKRKVKFELFRMWVVQRHPVYKEVGNLEEIQQPQIKSIYEEATRLYQENNKQKARELYTQILDFNPNNSSSLLALAEGDLEVENFDKAVERYTRAYKINPLHNKEKLLQTREKYAQKLITEGDLEGAKEQYQEVLKIETERLSTKHKLKVVEALLIDGKSHQTIILDNSQESALSLNPTNTKIVYLNSKLTFANSSFLVQKSFILSTIAAILAIASITGVVIYGQSTPCSAGENRELAIFCTADAPINISRGERTLFPTISNTNRNKGIDAYKQGNYSQATKLFAKAVVDGRNDPEVLIYKNNALARDKGSWITLAVVVPMDNADKAQEILRGVAQAQNQFNYNNGLNSKLLEIAIANDGNQNKEQEAGINSQELDKKVVQEKVKKLAQELVKDQEILGVIGHDSSDAMKVAINEYEKAQLAIPPVAAYF
jgi:tetratricopeptide (TPR) repeat protein